MADVSFAVGGDHPVDPLGLFEEHGRGDRQVHAVQDAVAVQTPTLVPIQARHATGMKRVEVAAHERVLVCAALLGEKVAADEVAGVGDAVAEHGRLPVHHPQVVWAVPDEEVVEAQVTVGDRPLPAGTLPPDVDARHGPVELAEDVVVEHVAEAREEPRIERGDDRGGGGGGLGCDPVQPGNRLE